MRTFSWVLSGLEVRKAGKAGLGVFANKLIDKNTIVAVAGGYVMTTDEAIQLPEELFNLTFQIEEGLFFGIKNKSEMEDNWRFNHSCDPNIGQRNQLSLIALRDIEKGEELTFDYAMVLCRISGQERWEMKCECGKKCCRNIVTDEDWMNPAIQNKYKGYFQPFIEERINQLKRKNGNNSLFMGRS